AKAAIGATFSIVLAATTEVPDILKGLSRLRVPPVLTSIASFMIRYLEVVAEELGRVRIAMTARGYSPRWIGQARPIAASAGALFIRSYERGERVYDAMLARGFSGTMPDMGSAPPTSRQWISAMAIPAAALGVAIAALVTT
ncbi:MAG: energy-coupling factor transporter transmembrane protein EcfT, partial [Acidimicrobiia bacterium]|nr:energy-coupling factor transporter transmembrane protein EcfT [Acidimicrobiia bacterium]